MVARRPYDEGMLRMEKLLSRVYLGGWPAHLWALWPAATRVQRLEHPVAAGRRPGRPPLRIAFASDFHLGPDTPKRLLDNAFAHLGAMQADVLALGGDYVFLAATRERREDARSSRSCRASLAATARSSSGRALVIRVRCRVPSR